MQNAEDTHSEPGVTDAARCMNGREPQKADCGVFGGGPIRTLATGVIAAG